MCVRLPFPGMVHLVFLFMCILLLHPKNVLGCDPLCQSNIIEGVKGVIKEQLNEIVVEKINEINSKFEDFKETIELKIKGVGSKIEDIKENMNSKIDSNFVYIHNRIDFMEDKLIKILALSQVVESERSSESQLNTRDVKRMQTALNSQVTSLFHTLLMDNERIDRCPGGIFVSTQCFTIYNTAKSTWADSKELCESKGLVLPETSKTVALILRRFLLERYGNGSFWLNARGDGKTFAWGHSDMVLNSDMDLWKHVQAQPPNMAHTDTYCLALSVYDENVLHNQHLYHPYECSQDKHFTLCERLLQDEETVKFPMQVLEDSITTKLKIMNQEMKTNNKELLNKQEIYKDNIVSAIDTINNGVMIKSNEIIQKQVENQDTIVTSLETTELGINKMSNDIMQKQDENQNTIVTTLDTMNLGIDKKSNTIIKKQGENQNIVVSIINTINQLIETTSQKIIQKEDTDQNNIVAALDKIESISRCPGGFMFAGKCLLLLTDKTRIWTDARSECQKHGHLAQIYDAVALRRLLYETYGDSTYVWLDGRGTGSVFKWQRSGETIPGNSPLWYPDYAPSDGKSSSSYCLLMLADGYYMDAHPKRPIYATECSTSRFALCELVVE